jgi:hypothetical protein
MPKFPYCDKPKLSISRYGKRPGGAFCFTTFNERGHGLRRAPRSFLNRRSGYAALFAPLQQGI